MLSYQRDIDMFIKCSSEKDNIGKPQLFKKTKTKIEGDKKNLGITSLIEPIAKTKNRGRPKSKFDISRR